MGSHHERFGMCTESSVAKRVKNWGGFMIHQVISRNMVCGKGSEHGLV